MADELIWMSAHELRDGIRRKEVSPVEAVEAVLNRLEEVNPAINAFVTVTADAARAQAKQAEAAALRGDDLPPLHGVPITIKDLADTAGVRTTYGCVAHAEYVPDTDAISWARLKAAGAILIGKTTTPEFGMLGVTDSHLTGATGTPWDPTRTSGGSSGGAAAAVAAGIAPLALGSDGGGSIRVPASCCGVVGVKPSLGRIPTRHNVDGDSTDGPLTRRVVDAALMLDVLVGPHDEDRFSLPATGENYTEAAIRGVDLGGLRFAYSVGLDQGPIDPETRRVVDAAMRDLAGNGGAGVDTVTMDLPDAIDYFLHYWSGGIQESMADAFPEGTEPWPSIVEFLQWGRKVSAADVSRAFRETRTQIYDGFLRILREYDFVVCATTPTPPFPHSNGKGGLDIVDGQQVRHPDLFFHRLTEPPTHAGLPVISVPCGFTQDGLPVGLQIIGRPHADAQLIAAAAAFEQFAPWSHHRPLDH
ncbi:Asp-tRNA(Asn)/Glu-tRNA(Gln) amidotransferase A subunit family amidase [Kibdelosporangium banguiense]|uniref:Asp-tRNA(Asn)/Glu-tRNA(Gln) amidotransferase A subunit family amidase n=1 Tax=Kibdelosporangium banguiense TaxID=1365924 RepID=A0ABS4TRB8_9PSEU|nr:amidase [Kibdelosporangium banguiense]MBP2326453.1 Asp-tRNA(Asn)/Glu-tRNA(Gln) amidotransferase A subunit family amidase [Kibdelosporangium banguiense]